MVTFHLSGPWPSGSGPVKIDHHRARPRPLRRGRARRHLAGLPSAGRSALAVEAALIWSRDPARSRDCSSVDQSGLTLDQLHGVKRTSPSGRSRRHDGGCGAVLPRRTPLWNRSGPSGRWTPAASRTFSAAAAQRLLGLVRPPIPPGRSCGESGSRRSGSGWIRERNRVAFSWSPYRRHSAARPGPPPGTARGSPQPAPGSDQCVPQRGTFAARRSDQAIPQPVDQEVILLRFEIDAVTSFRSPGLADRIV
jgi:hypothetical protein